MFFSFLPDESAGKEEKISPHFAFHDLYVGIFFCTIVIVYLLTQVKHRVINTVIDCLNVQMNETTKYNG